jgi:carbamoyl-phosphate synthase large subunit
MVQDLIRGEEITTAFYVTKDRELLGHITLSRSLENGATSQCKVVTQFDEKLIPIMKKMIEHIPIAGSVNIQSIVTKEGNVVPFEVNCRISGTNSIRSNFGFKDVEYTIQEFLYGRKPSKPVITKGVAVRVLQDVIYPDQSDYEVLKNNSSHHFLF